MSHQSVRIYEILAGFDASEGDNYRQRKEWEETATEMILMLGTEGVEELREILESARGRPGVEFMFYAMLDRWVQLEPLSAIDYLAAPADFRGYDAHYARGRTIKAWAQNDLPGAAEFVAGLPSGEDKQAASHALFPVFIGADHKAALRWLGDQPDPELRRMALIAGVNFAFNARQNHPEADAIRESLVHWLTAHGDQDYSLPATATWSASLALRDPYRVLHTLKEFPPGAVREESVAILFERLALFEPSLVLDWLSRNEEMTDFIAAADGLARALRSHGYDPAGFGSFSTGNRSK